MTSGKLRTKEEIEEIVNDLGYVLLDECIEKRLRRVFIQDELGYKYNVELPSLILGNIPYFVGKENPNTLENIVIWLQREEKPFELCENNEYKESSKKLWFHCLVPECNMNFDTSWDNIYSGMQGCPFCSGKRVSDKNRLSIIRPDIADQWDNKLNKDSPNDFSYGSKKKRWWICPKNHQSYPATIANRTNRGSGCPRCADEQKESKMATELKRWAKDTFKDIDVEHSMFKNPETGAWLKCDIYLGEKETINGVYIEVHGEQHYKFNSKFHKDIKDFEDSKTRDKIKKKYAQENGTYIEIDLRKIKTTEDAIVYIENIIGEIENDSVPKRSYRKISYKV